MNGIHNVSSEVQLLPKCSRSPSRGVNEFTTFFANDITLVATVSRPPLDVPVPSPRLNGALVDRSDRCPWAWSECASTVTPASVFKGRVSSLPLYAALVSALVELAFAAASACLVGSLVVMVAVVFIEGATTAFSVWPVDSTAASKAVAPASA